jgi:hypothetical protein
MALHFPYLLQLDLICVNRVIQAEAIAAGKRAKKFHPLLLFTLKRRERSAPGAPGACHPIRQTSIKNSGMTIVSTYSDTKMNHSYP